MKRTEKKLKTKGIKGHGFTHDLCEKYDRNYLAKSGTGFIHLPFSRCAPSDWDWKRNVRLCNYLNRWFDKQVGKSVDDVFHSFKMLGWKSSHDMYYYWDWYVRAEHYRKNYYYCIDENGYLMPGSENTNYSTPKSVGGSKDEDDGKPKAKRYHVSDKRLTRKHLEYNASVKVPDMGVRNSFYAELKLMGEFYIKYNHKVIKCPVYHYMFPLNPKYEYFTTYQLPETYVPVKILGPYREELKYVQHHWDTKVVTEFNSREQILEAEVKHHDIGCGELQPCVRRNDAEGR